MYYVVDFARENFLCKLEHVEEGTTSNNLTKVITKAVCDVTRMSRPDISDRMLAFGACMNLCSTFFKLD
jgi:hypothetical protein